MFRNSRTWILSLVTASVAVSLLTAGSLIPPAGPVASTDKPIVEAEPRILLSAAKTPGDGNSVFKITQAGSYYLGANLAGEAGKHGIEIEASNVTIDLAGFSLAGVAGTLTGVHVASASRQNIRVTNGTASNWGRWGLDIAGDGAQVDRVRATGCGFGGISVGSGAIVSHCTAQANLDDGIAMGFSSVVDASASFDNLGVGIVTSTGCTITGCTAYSNSGNGISVQSATIVKGCTVYLNGTNGINAGDSCIISGNTARQNGQVSAGAGILVIGTGTRVEDNSAFLNNSHGIRIDGTRNFTVRNTAGGQGANDYLFANPNTYGEVWNATGGLVITSSPWGNWKLN